jgi:hypothetical protein
MIPDESAKAIFSHCENILQNYWENNLLGPSQFYRGITTNLWKDSYTANCERHMLIFQTNNVIPEYCFNCYKILVEPRDVLELFKLMIIFNGIQLPNNNTRKCMVETRAEISGTYKGLVYSQNLEEAKGMLLSLREIISKEISPEITISLKRGCSEYAISYPEYTEFDDENIPTMQYRPEWRDYEKAADENGLAEHFPPILVDNINPKGYTLGDAKVMLNWLKYAATIEDVSYLKIASKPISKLKGLVTRS